jgi:hypothetical protein
MKVIGITEVGEGYGKQKAYVAIITEQELRMVADKARHYDADKFPALTIGQEYDIAAGYHFRNELTAAIKAMNEAYTKFAKVAPLAAEFAGIALPKTDDTTTS